MLWSEVYSNKMSSSSIIKKTSTATGFIKVIESGFQTSYNEKIYVTISRAKIEVCWRWIPV